MRWKQNVEAEGFNVLPGNGNGSPMEEELQRLRAENKRLFMDRDIPKNNGLLCQ
jgi:hypothetical protein